jgi:hypothetical protein
MRRLLLNVLTAPSLLLCAAVVVAGARSYARMDHFQWTGDKANGPRVKSWAWDWKLEWGMMDLGRDAATYTCESAEDALLTRRASRPRFHRTGPATPARPLGGSFWDRLGFFWYHEQSQSVLPKLAAPVRSVSRDHWYVRAPLWPLCLATAAPPAAWWAIRRRDKRRGALVGRCRRCGYDLRATPHRCPECGVVKANL